MEIYRSNRNCDCLRCRYRGIMGSVVLMTVGALFLLENFHLHDLDWDHTWPLLLIVIGVMLMLQRTAPTEGHIQPFAGQPFPTPPIPPVPPMPGGQSFAGQSSEVSREVSSEVRHE
jgi:Domain of unknown function (DUF5668)